MSAEPGQPALWARIKEAVQKAELAGTKAGQWSARKAQLAVRRYKEAGGTYIGEKSADNHLVRWTRQRWRTKSGKPSHVTGERYLPAAAIAGLSAAEYRATTRAKRRGTRRGRQFVPQPAAIRRKTRRYRE